MFRKENHANWSSYASLSDRNLSGITRVVGSISSWTACGEVECVPTSNEDSGCSSTLVFAHIRLCLKLNHPIELLKLFKLL